MKVCNNCSTTNNLPAVKCIACNMHGNFTLLEGSKEIPAPILNEVSCMNCGNHHSGAETHCHHCRFPISQGHVRSFSNRTVQLIRKVG